MEKVSLNKQPDNKLTLFTMGLRLDVQPYWLVKEMISENSQKMLDSMIESQFRILLNSFDKWQQGIINALAEGDDPDFEFVKHKRDVHVKEIQDIADFSRNLLELHTDWEGIITEDDERIIEIAYEYWKYNIFYGYEDSKETTL